MRSVAFVALAALLDAAAGPAAEPPQPPPAAGASTRKDARKYASYDYAEPAKQTTMRLTIPEGLEVVRGVLVVAPFSGGDTRDFHREAWSREFLHRHGFAFLGAECYVSHAEQFRVMQRALKQFAADSKHPELVHAPYAAMGFSAGGGFAGRLLVEAPDKVIAVAAVGSRLRLTDVAVTDAHRGVPALVIVEPVLAEHRPKGALWGWMAVPGIGHARDGQEVLAVPMLDATVRLRYPADGDPRKGPVTLKPADPRAGWVADNTTWKGGLAAVAPAKDFTGVVGKSSWLLNEDLAAVYRAYATHDRPLAIASPRTDKGLVWDAGTGVTITVDDARFAGWKKLELYDGATKVGELDKGPAVFTVKGLKAGYHPFSVLGTDGRGRVRPSDPVLVVVRP
jgi:hypothetical protein